MLHFLVILFWVLVIILAATYVIFRLDLDGKTLHFLEPIVHKLCGHKAKW